MDNKLVDLLVIKRDNHENRHIKNLILKHKLNNKKNLDVTILLIMRLPFPLINYKSLAT
jgi:hypothetical protein